MGRYSPTVIAQAGPSFADGLLAGVNNYIAERDRKRQQGRQDVQDTQAAGRYQSDMQTAAAQRGTIELQQQAARNELALQPYEDQAKMRASGFVPNTPVPDMVLPAPAVYGQPSQGTVTINGGSRGYHLDPQLAPIAPREAFANTLQMEGIKAQQARDNLVFTQNQENTRNATSAKARTDAARIGATSRDYATDARASTLANGKPLTLLQKETLANKTADDMINAYAGQLGPVQQWFASDEAADARANGLTANHLLAAQGRYNQRQQSQTTRLIGTGMVNGVQGAQAVMDSVRGKPAPAATAGGAGARSPIAQAPAAGKIPVAQRDAQLKALGMSAADRRAKLKAEGYNVQ